MNDCEFYEEESKRIAGRNPIGNRQRQRPAVVCTPWCSHPKHSPVDREIATGLGGGDRLQCGGDLDKCPLTEAQRIDV